ncbi:beta-galactosidase [Candidatus Kaiserbacteria bacterium]|nr:beta-galactosidase [Candidatus Kaiserbacteria bacterium]
MKYFAAALIIVVAGTYLLSMRAMPESLEYGVSFSKLHAEELGLDWKETYLAILDELGVKKIRLSAHWPMIEPERDQYDFSALDYQMRAAREQNAEVILAVGRKAPGWPECHTPHWVGYMEWEEQKMEIRQYVTAVVERYKEYPNLSLWQVENEPFLNFARHICGEPDEEFFAEEIALVRELDPTHEILVTDGGEFGLWYKAREYADVFGSTMYVYVYTKHIGYWRYPITPGFFRLKQNLADVFFGKKPSISVEVGLEPWMHQGISHSSVTEQLERMSLERFEDVLSLAARSGFAEHYLWGAEWWYYIKEHGHPEFWERASVLFQEPAK